MTIGDYEQRDFPTLLPGLPFVAAVLAIAAVFLVLLGINPLDAFARMFAIMFGFCC